MDEPTKVTKKQTIEALCKEGKKPEEIHRITGFSLGYIRNVKEGVDKPGIWGRRQKLYLKNNQGIFTEQHKKYRRKYRGEHPEKWQQCKRRNLLRHSDATRPHATNHKQGWTTRDIEYLQRYGQLKTIRQLALDLGRTYSAILNAGQKFKIDLRGNKTKTPSSRVPPPSVTV